MKYIVAILTITIFLISWGTGFLDIQARSITINQGMLYDKGIEVYEYFRNTDG